MYNYDIVIIDTGIERQHDIFKNLDVVYAFGVDIVQGKVCRVDQFQDEIGHGTAVAGIIASQCSSAELCIVKIFGESFDVSLDKLVFALCYIEKNFECKLINLSLGAAYYSAELERVCERLKEKGCIIVSAFDNDGAISYPAALDSVIGVDASERCKRPSSFMVESGTIVDVLAYGYNHRVAWLNNSYIITRGSSFSTAYITAKLYNDYVKRHGKVSIKDAKKFLLRCSSNKESKSTKKCYHIKRCCNNEVKKKQMVNAAIFPYNKEMHSLTNFAHLLPFKIKHVYDLKQLGKIGTRIKGIRSGQEFVIENIEDVKWSDIDALVIGHLDQINALGVGQIKVQLLKKCLKHNVNVYTFDRTDAQKYMIPFSKKNLWLKYPNMDGNAAKDRRLKLYAIESPILGVFGTSSNQGKFTLQLQLREYFMRDSYSVGQIGTEPSSLLFGMDKVFAYGYASHIQLERISVVEKMNELLHEVDKLGRDIILVGGQSGTIPVYSYHLKYYNINTLNVLMGANPDGIVLCVNLFDSIDYLARCVYAITNLVDCKIIAIAISPLTIQNNWQRINGTRIAADKNEIERFKEILWENFYLNSYIIGTEEIEELYYQCLDFFTYGNEK